jgi:ATP-dependent Lon protease
LAEIPDNVKSGLDIIPVSRMDEVIAHALTAKPKAIEWTESDGEVIKPAVAEDEAAAGMVAH